MTRVLAAVLCLAATAAQAGPPCLPHEQMAEELNRRYGEVRRFAGAAPGQVTEIYTNEQTGTWTMVHTNVQGISCIRGAGHGASFYKAEDKA